MFAGIIREIGVIKEVTPKDSTTTLSIRSGAIFKESKIGDSISVDGVCLTVAGKSKELLYFDLMKETLKSTAMAFIKRLDKVNLEPSLELREGVMGHLVSGHIDEVGRIRKTASSGQGVMQFIIGISNKSTSFLVPKGSVAVNGISLTVNDIGRDFFVVDLIPHTLKATTMGIKKIGTRVNIEFDMIGKYVLTNLSWFKAKMIDENFLRENGFI